MKKRGIDDTNIQALIAYGLIKNDIDIESIDKRRLEIIMEDYDDYCKEFKTKFVKGELDTFKKAACLLVAINRSRLVADKRVNALVAIEAAQKMCEKPYWNVGANYDIPQAMEEVNFDRAFAKYMDVYEKSRDMLVEAMLYGNGVEPLTCYMNLELFYRLGIELEKKQIEETNKKNNTSKR